MGIWQAFFQAYHHQVNGRAERAGQSLMEILRKIYEEKGINWVEALPQTLDRYHDVPNLSGIVPIRLFLGGTDDWGMCPMSPRLSVRMSRNSLRV